MPVKKLFNFHRGKENKQEPKGTEPGQTTAAVSAFLPDDSFSEFLLSSPLAGSELEIPRDYVIDREIVIQP
jgi:hypothetical protein